MTEDEAVKCKCQWPLFRSRINKLTTEKVYEVYVDMLKENEEDIDAMLILLALLMTISISTCQCERGFSGINQQKTKENVSRNHATLNLKP